MLSYKTVTLALLTLQALGAPIRREVPQEHSHNEFLASVRTSLAKNNPAKIVDPVFGLLGDAAAKAGQGSITDTDCLQQATADQAFTNAKAAGDVQGMVDALIYRALERNTGKVGLASVACTSIKAVNPQIAAISQHQDPASTNAASVNKAIVLALAQQIKSVGGDPQDALKSGTFKPGNLNDNTGKGNTCDDANDTVGCIFTQNLLVEDATADEINSAVAGVSGGSGAVVASAAAAAAKSATTTAASQADTTTSSSSSIGNFGKCSIPQIKFAVGFDNRKETSFEPVDQVSYNHGSADNIDIITQFMCDTLTNTCGADATAKATCGRAQKAADTVTAKTGGQADAFNAVFGIKTDFAAVAEVDDQGRIVAGTGSATLATTSSSSSSSSSIGNFGKCTIPQIKFAVGFDGRKETSFEPVDQVSYNHGSADNIDIITQFMCNTLTNTCGADATAKATCAKAQKAADTVTAKTGGQADAFNAVFGIKTDFAAIAEVNDQGQIVAGTGSSNAASTSTTSTSTTSSSSSIGNFGKCTIPQIKFGTGFDNRKETAFEPVDQVSFNHGSADNIDVITQFICNTLTNTCDADATAKVTCAKAEQAADAATAKTGAQADAFNAVFGIKTNFAAVAEVDDTGKVVAGTGSASSASTTSASTTSASDAQSDVTTTSTSGNLQTFTGALGGPAPPVTVGGRAFVVSGESDSFLNLSAALGRSCDVQHNKCADFANSAAGRAQGLSVSKCDTQDTQCKAA